MPGGLSLSYTAPNNSATITGSPTAVGVFNFTIAATDTTGAMGSQAYQITIGATITLSPPALPGWDVNLAGYSQTVTASGGTGNKTLTITGMLPPGL